MGSAAAWANITVRSNNEPLSSATVYYYSETEPTDSTDKYWHYDENGNIVVWNTSEE